MDIYNFLRWNLAWMATVALLWPLNIGWMAVAYKIRQGNKPITLESTEFWTRCSFAALFLALLTVGVLGLDFYLVSTELPVGIVHLVIFVGYGVASCWLLFVMFAMEDPFEGLSLFFIYMYVPIAVLWVINRLFGWWQPLLEMALGWLKAS